MENYVVLSLETHLFFARIMKEHALFLEAGFLPQHPMYRKEADRIKTQFEQLLYDVVKMSDGLVRNSILDSGEIVTQFTIKTEQMTQDLTGITIDSNITLMEQLLSAGCGCITTPEMEQWVQNLNQTAIQMLDEIIFFKQQILSEVLSCKLFTANYPLLIDHILREAKLYRSNVAELEHTKTLLPNTRKQTELFWNRIMMEHAMFIRGLLDPTEEELINTADGFAKDYALLLEEARKRNDAMMGTVTRKTIEETRKYRNFKAAGTEGIAGCNIRSIILPLLADHVLREANHYLRILGE